MKGYRIEQEDGRGLEMSQTKSGDVALRIDWRQGDGCVLWLRRKDIDALIMGLSDLAEMEFMSLSTSQEALYLLIEAGELKIKF